MSLSRDLLLKLAILSATAVGGGTLALCVGLRFPWSDVLAPLGIVVALGPCAVFYQRRQADEFVSTLLAVIQLLLFTACFTVLMYSLAACAAPLRDDVLIRIDSALGISVPDIAAWAQRFPAAAFIVELAYNSVLPQTLALVLLLGFRGDRKPLEQFVLRFMVALLATAVIFSVAPAVGPFAVFGLEPNPTQQAYLAQLEGLRNGTLTSVSLADTEGLVTFPSFHTAWAILLTAAVWHRRKLRVPVAVLNALVIAGTLTTGWHYVIDVLAGAALAAVTIAATNRLRPWLEESRVES
jgi:membrane-associated phospholipid phosphatase